MAWTGKSLPILQGSIGPACVSILPITRCLELHWEIQINQPTRCSNISSLLLDVYVQLNMFRGVLTPIIRSSTTAVAASGFTIGAWW
jgi:DNA-binding IclR family transcriptional regulator